jgi:hypothetical protein
MANQDPQPEIYTTTHNFDASAADVTAGTTNTVTVYTNQANNEEVRIYAIEVLIQDEDGTPVTTLTDFDIAIGVGPNNVPSNSFNINGLNIKMQNGGEPLAFPCPILVLFQQPLQITIEVMTTIATASDRERTVKVNLIGELAIQKVACRT